MSKLTYSITLSAPADKLIKIITDYENLNNFAPKNMKKIKIIQKNQEGVTTEEILVFKTIIKNEIIQKTFHKSENNVILDTIIDGPAKGTTIETRFENVGSGTKVIINIDLRLNFKAKIFSPLVKKVYKQMITGILYKINTKACFGDL